MKMFYHRFLIDKWREQFLVSLSLINLGSDEAAIISYWQAAEKSLDQKITSNIFGE